MKGRIVGTHGICFKPKVCTVGILFRNRTSFTFGLGVKWCRHLSRMVTYFPLSLSLSLNLTLTHSQFYSHSLYFTYYLSLTLSHSTSLFFTQYISLSLNFVSLSHLLYLSHWAPTPWFNFFSFYLSQFNCFSLSFSATCLPWKCQLIDLMYVSMSLRREEGGFRS